MEYDVTIDRDIYIGGSDIPAIMGISTFKTRYQLLMEKAGIVEPDFAGSRYTVYGQHLEPKIRDYINKGKKKKFEPDRVIKDDLRGNMDGFNGNCVLEIKTTSHTYETVDEYKVYLVQLLFYMQLSEVKKGVLAVYERPDDFDENFDSDRLKVYEIDIKTYAELLDEINVAVDSFRKDLARLKENPLLSEEDFQPTEVVALSNQVLAFERKIAEYKTLEEDYKKVKQQLYEAMQKHDVKSWTTVNGVKVTRVDGSEPTTETVTEFDEKQFKKDCPDEYEKYCVAREKKVKGRSGFIKITLPKG